MDETGKVIWRWESDAFGTTPAKEDPDGDGVKTTVNLRFPDSIIDQETGLHYNGLRYYDPSMGSTFKVIRLGWRVGVSPRLRMFGGNPLNSIDPLGLNVYIIINRTTYTTNSIIGTINVVSTSSGQTFTGNTLENAAPPNSHLPVPAGTYAAKTRESDNYPVDRIQLDKVPFASAVQIHNGNTSDDVIGCFAAGTSASKNRVSDSINAMDKINDVISSHSSGKITVMLLVERLGNNMTIFMRGLLLFILLASLPTVGFCNSIWDDFLLKPNNKNLTQIRTSIVNDSNHCGSEILPTDIQIPKLLKLIEDGNETAFQAGILVSSCLGVGDLEDFYRSAGIFLVVSHKIFCGLLKGNQHPNEKLDIW